MPKAAEDRRQASRGLTPKQRDFLDWLVTPRNMRQESTQKKWCEAHQVAQATASAWKRDAKFRTAWDDRLGALQVDPERVDEVLNSMHMQAVNGNVNAAKLWLEVSDRFRPKVEIVDSRAELKGLSDEELDALVADALANEVAERAAGD